MLDVALEKDLLNVNPILAGKALILVYAHRIVVEHA